LARSHAEEALLTVVDLLRTSKDERLRLACANTILDRAFGKPREGEVVEQQDIATMRYPTLAEIKAELIANGLPIDHLSPPKLIEIEPSQRHPSKSATSSSKYRGEEPAIQNRHEHTLGHLIIYSS